MPTVINENQNLYREYVRTPIEHEVVALKNKIKSLEFKLEQAIKIKSEEDSSE